MCFIQSFMVSMNPLKRGNDRPPVTAAISRPPVNRQSLGEPSGPSFGARKKHERGARTASLCYLTHGCLFSPSAGTNRVSRRGSTAGIFSAPRPRGAQMTCLTWKRRDGRKRQNNPDQTLCKASRLDGNQARGGGALLQARRAGSTNGTPASAHKKHPTVTSVGEGGSEGWSPQKPGGHSQLPEPHTQPQ